MSNRMADANPQCIEEFLAVHIWPQLEIPLRNITIHIKH